ncbi:unnamed protein product, partial [Pleuronectes platessa]
TGPEIGEAHSRLIMLNVHLENISTETGPEGYVWLFGSRMPHCVHWPAAIFVCLRFAAGQLSEPRPAFEQPITPTQHRGKAISSRGAPLSHQMVWEMNRAIILVPGNSSDEVKPRRKVEQGVTLKAPIRPPAPRRGGGGGGGGDVCPAKCTDRPRLTAGYRF